MRSVLLIAANFLRMQRWYVLLLVALVAGSSFFYRSGAGFGGEELQDYLGQQAAYAIGSALLIAGSAIYNERRSRRILGVLSKAVSRAQYVVGLWLGVLLVMACFCAATTAGASWIAGAGSLGAIWLFGADLLVASALVGAVAILFGSMVNPVVAGFATAIVLSVQFGLETGLRGGPVLAISHELAALIHGTITSLDAWPVAAVLMESCAVIALACWVFSSRDVTAAIE